MYKKKTYLILLFALLHFSSKAQTLVNDTVFKKAHIATGKQDFPLLDFKKQTRYPLKDEFSIQKAKEALPQLTALHKEIASTIALGNNYAAFISEQLQIAKLPETYKWIPFVLTGMINNTYDEHGRAGLWLIPYPVGIKHGITQNTHFDNRLDFKTNTITAIAHIKELITEFNDTTLALTAYFNGIGITKYAIQKAGSTSPESIYPHLPVATRNDIYTWNMLAAILSHPKNVSTERVTIESMAALERVELPKETHFMAVAKVLDISSLTLHNINPTLVGNFIPKGTYMRLPLGQKTHFDRLADSIYHYQENVVTKPHIIKPPTPSYSAPPKGSNKIIHTVKSGENLGAIASKHHVYVSQIKGWNGITSDRIYVGQKIIIYSNYKAPVKTQTTTTSEGTFTYYTVKSGDSLWGIAQKYPGVSTEDIQRWNNIGNQINIGQKLKIKVK